MQGSATGLNLTVAGSSVMVPGHNVTANFTLTNEGEESSTAPVIELVSVPAEWEIVAQSAGENVTWSEAQRGWVSAESLAPGESISASVTFRLSNDSAPTEYYVSANASDAEGQFDTAVETYPVDRTSDEDLTLETSVAETTAPGQNVTMDVTVENVGDADSAAPVVGLVLPEGWSVVNQSAEENVTYSEAKAEWVSSESLAPGETMTVSATLRPANETSAGEYFVSVRGYDATNQPTAAVATITVTEPAGTGVTQNETASETQPETTDAAAMATTTTEASETAEAAETTEASETTETTETTRAQNITETVSATFRVDGESVANVTLEVADSSEERAQGLMFRESLPENHGMVFVYENAEPRSFWMKNTLIPLDMIFVAENGTVVDVEHAVPQPNASDEELETYRSDAPAKYVIELERGFANRTGIEPGAEVEFDVPGTLEPSNETTTEA